MTRQEANYHILEKIKKAVDIHKDWRFHQILQNIGIEQVYDGEGTIDKWYEESVETLKGIE